MHDSSDLEIMLVQSIADLDLQAAAELAIVGWGRQPTAEEIGKRVSRLAAEVASLDPTRKAIFLARKSGKLAGFAKVARDENNSAHWWLIGLVVHPDHRHQGIGRALAKARIAYARSRGAAVIRSETHQENVVSIAYHEGIGFRNDGPFTASDGDRKVAFSLGLEPPEIGPST